ncbi:hypothetical protein A0J48_013505 [Sphaerospermopsis aphanizomenoides BCCUSP55]|uniref:hypothetical protein n=1 Tax=Sphaerospermopsis aphanizomenoides TaxID=459663 RepID=UPI001908B05F|nr:hypothetical protein [Sphaerospermopsis aphanizomenoides]MBK1988542.1 hypothetical protein [Sphaerospermopsis aphanizomenoides BCCUSP55]
MRCNCQEFETKYPTCTFCNDGQKITVQENKRKYIINNLSDQRICRIKIDGCVIDAQNQRKCDYLIIVCKTEAVANDNNIDVAEKMYFIELKGQDLISAVEQLTQTIEYFKPQITGTVFARAVLSRVSKFNAPKSIENDSRVKKLKSLLKKYGGNFEYSSVQFEKDKI